MTIKQFLPALLIAASSTTAMLLPMSDALAQGKHSGSDRFTVYADVIRAEPIYREVVTRHPTQQCWTEEERYIIREGYSNHGYNNNRGNRGSNRRSSGSGDTLVGTVIGGVIGNQLGRNSSDGARVGATVAGAIIGSVLANEAHASNTRGNGSHRRNRHDSHRRNNRHSPNHNSPSHTQYGVRPVERCETVVHNRVEQRIDGYNVTYVHRGRRFHTKTRKDPGSQIAIQLNVTPVRGQ